MLSASNPQFFGLAPDALFAPVAGENTVGLAVSGGADSLALLLLAAQWAKGAGRPDVIVYTLDHGLRAEAAAETAMVAQTARRLGLACRVLRWDGDKPSAGVQAAARSARYRLIGEAMAADCARVLLTAHHRDDQAETVLMRLAHGSGVAGLAGMRDFSTVEGVRVYRPLLAVPGDTLARIVDAAGLAPAQDPSNDDLHYERVRWRKAMPLLDDLGLSPERLAVLARRLARIDDFADSVCAGFWATSVRLDDFGAVHIERAGLAAVPEELRVRVLRRAVAIAGGLADAPLGPIEAAVQAIAGGATIERSVAGTIVSVQAHAIVIYRQAGRIAPDTMALSWGAPVVWDGRFEIAAQRAGLSLAPATAMSRALFRALTGDVPPVRVAALRAAPLVTDRAGRVLALGARCFSGDVSVTHIALTG